MPEVGIVMTLNDKLSSALKTIAGNVKAFDKDIDDLDASFRGLAETHLIYLGLIIWFDDEFR